MLIAEVPRKPVDGKAVTLLADRYFPDPADPTNFLTLNKFVLYGP